MNQFNSHERNINPATVLIAATLLLLSGVALISRIQRLNTEQEWDVLIFSQRWPNTACMEWEEKHGNCSLPRQKGHWTIHGIWPTKFGTKGPSFCNKSIAFNITALDGIRNQLDEYWTDIEVGGGHKPNSFWKHEWLKHGTCASSIESLNTELKYFQQALKMYKDYNMIEVLGVKSIHPKGITDGYKVEDISVAVNVAIGRNPYIECVHDSRTGLPFLSEIRICFDKNLILVDCDGIKLERSRRSLKYKSVLTNCPEGKPIVVYPRNVPSSTRQLAAEKTEHFLVNLYKTLEFLSWFTS